MIGLVLVSGADETKRVVTLLVLVLLGAAVLVGALTTWYWAHTSPKRRYRPGVAPAGASSASGPDPLPLRQPYDPTRPPPGRVRPVPGPFDPQPARGGRQGAYADYDAYRRHPDLEVDQFGNPYQPAPRRQPSRRG